MATEGSTSTLLLIVVFGNVAVLGILLPIFVAAVAWAHRVRRAAKERHDRNEEMLSNMESSCPVHVLDGSQENDDWGMCAICLASFSTGAKVRTLPCGDPGHMYHQDCIDLWYKGNYDASTESISCPICRGSVCISPSPSAASSTVNSPSYMARTVSDILPPQLHLEDPEPVCYSEWELPTEGSLPHAPHSTSSTHLLLLAKDIDCASFEQLGNQECADLHNQVARALDIWISIENPLPHAPRSTSSTHLPAKDADGTFFEQVARQECADLRTT